MSEKTDAKKVSDSGGKSEKQLKSGEILFLLKNMLRDMIFFLLANFDYIFLS